MATISENLQTLNEAKQAIKAAIENKGQDLTDVPFTQYAEKIEAIKQGEGERSIKKFLEAGGKFKMSEVVDYRPLLEYNDTENLTTCWSLFDSATPAEYIPLLNTKNCYNFGYMFLSLTKIKEIPFIDTTKGKTFSGFVKNCYVLPVVPAFDIRNGNQLAMMFENCRSLTEIWIKNIKANIQVASGDAYGHLLTLESLIHLIKELRDTGSLKTLTIGNVNLEKLANVYVRIVDITDEMRAEDDLIDEKLPFEVCESTDEGAMLITDYVALKNWSIA